MSVNKKDVIVKIQSLRPYSGVLPSRHGCIDSKMVSVSYQCGLRVFEFMHQRDNKGLRFFEHLAGRLTNSRN